MAATPPAAQKISFNLSLKFGSTSGQERILAKVSDETGSGNQGQAFNYTLAGSATNATVNLSSYLSRLDNLVIVDRGNKGFKVGLSNTGTKVPVIAGGSFAYKHDNSGTPTPPTLYFDAMGADPTDLEISIAGNTVT